MNRLRTALAAALVAAALAPAAASADTPQQLTGFMDNATTGAHVFSTNSNDTSEWDDWGDAYDDADYEYDNGDYEWDEGDYADWDEGSDAGE